MAAGVERRMAERGRRDQAGRGRRRPRRGEFAAGARTRPSVGDYFSCFLRSHHHHPTPHSHIATSTARRYPAHSLKLA